MNDARKSLNALVDSMKPVKQNNETILQASVRTMGDSDNELRNFVDKFSEVTSTGLYHASAAGAKLRDGTFNNEMMKLGTSDIKSSSGRFELSMITFQRMDILAFYHGCWVFRRIIDRVAQDLWSSGITINATADSTVLEKVYKRLSRLRSDLIYGTQQSRLFGGAASLIMVDDEEEDLTQPLKLFRIKKGSKIKLFTTDRWFGLDVSSERVSNYAHTDFNTPKYYTFTLDDGTSVKVHHTRVLRYTNRRSPRLIEQYLMGWGVSELEHIYQDLLNHENTKNSAASLVAKSLLEIIKLNGMKSTMQGLSSGNTASQQMFAGQMSALNEFRSSNNLIFMDKDDDYDQKTYSFSGLSEILTTQKELIAGAAEMPQVLLFGDTKGGMTSDSPAEMEFYAQTILGKQDQEIRPILDKLLPILFRLEGADIPADLDYDFESVAGTPQEKKLNLLQGVIQAVQNSVDLNIMTRETALKEIQQVQRITGFGLNIEDKDYELAKSADEADKNNTDDENENEITQDEFDEDLEETSFGDSDYELVKQKIFEKHFKDKIYKK